MHVSVQTAVDDSPVRQRLGVALPCRPHQSPLFLPLAVDRQVHATTPKQVKKSPARMIVAGLLGVFASAMRHVAARVNAAKRIAIMSAPRRGI